MERKLNDLKETLCMERKLNGLKEMERYQYLAFVVSGEVVRIETADSTGKKMWLFGAREKMV